MNVVSAVELDFAYSRGAQPVLHRFGLEVAPGEMVALVGRSGEGKSTLLYLLGLFLRPTAGDVFVCGLRARELSDDERSRVRAHRIGFVFQDAALHPHLTLRENVAEGAYYSGEQRSSALNRADQLLAEHGIGDVAGHRPAQVSGGQAQRAALCRALIRSPALVLADEPTGSIDEDNATRVVTSLRRAASCGAAVVVATHSADMAGSCDRVVRITRARAAQS